MQQNPVNIKNKKAKFEYQLIDKYVAGIVLTGTEIKSIRMSKASIVEAYCVFENHELLVRNMFINEYENGSYNNHSPRRDRKLLLNRQELNKLEKKVNVKGFSIVPTNLFIDEKGRAKLVIFLSEGKKTYDKREDLKLKDTKRDLERAMKK
jgi:SsrA-binding protein